MNRERLTITLRKDLLKALDSTIDGEKIRNRSHAIEFFLSQTLAPKGTKAFILAGGKNFNFLGKEELPKAMAPVFGKPLLEYTLERLKKTAGITEVIISVGKGGKKIKNYFGDGAHLGLNISYIEQNQAKPGTAQPILQGKAELSAGPFIVLYGDVLTDLNFGDLLEFHRSQKNAIATMALTSVEHVSMWGVVRVVGNRIISLEEKPEKPKTHSHLVNAGVYVMEPGVFKYILPEALRLEKDLFPRLADEAKLGGYPFDGQWYDVGSLQDYKQAVQMWRQ